MWRRFPSAPIAAIQYMTYYPTVMSLFQRCPHRVEFPYRLSKLGRGVERLFLEGDFDETLNVCTWMEENLTGKCRIKTSHHHVVTIGFYVEPRNVKEVWSATFEFAKVIDAVKFKLLYSD